MIENSVDYLISKNKEPIKYDGDEVIFNCFFYGCDDKTGHLSVNKKTDKFRCWKCPASGNLVTLKKHFGDYEEKSKKPSLQYILDKVRNNDKSKCIQYLVARCIPEKIAKACQDHFFYSNHPKYGEAIIFPVYRNGEIISLSFKQLDGGKAKFLGGYETKGGYWPNLTIKEVKENCILVESAINWLTMQSIPYFRNKYTIISSFSSSNIPDILSGANEINIFIDNDPASEKWAQRVKNEHPEKIVRKCIWLKKTLKGYDVNDLAQELKDPQQLEEAIIAIDFDELKEKKLPKKENSKIEGEDGKVTQSQRLLAFAENIDLFHTSDNQVYAVIPIENHEETWPIKSKEFKRWLKRKFYLIEKKPPGGQAFQDAFDQLEAKGQYDSPQCSIFTRLAEHKGKIYLDLLNDDWEVVEITQNDWKIISDPPVKFRRTKGMLPLPKPIKGGSLDKLKPFVNIKFDDDWKLFISWLVGSLRPTGPYPILIFQGEQGSAKSFTSRVTRSIIDPSIASLRTIPREERDLMVAGNNSWVIAFDNISSLKDWLSDALCRISTGGGFSKRQNYTDDEEVLFDVMRPILLNGIDSIVTRHDLADRAIIINLPSIPEDERKLEYKIQQGLDNVLPEIIGALCYAVSEGIKNLPNTVLSKLPRMADFALWVSAVEPALPWKKGEFLKAYTKNRKEVVELTLEADMVACAIRKLIEKEWKGVASELLVTLGKYVSEEIKKSKSWPKKPNLLSGKLKRAATFLRTVNIYSASS